MMRRPTICAMLVIVASLIVVQAIRVEASDAPFARSLHSVIAQVQPKIVKIYGAGGFRGLEPYQSGFLVSADGDILTAWSYVLDTEYLSVTLDDGRKFDAKLVSADPRLELAVIKIEAHELPHFNLAEAVPAEPGTGVLAFSNLFGVATGDESASVQRGVVAVRSTLDARRGAYETPYRGAVYVLDAITNNPGAAGGALTDRQGRLLGMLGKELRSATNNTWLNYALPVSEMVRTVDEIREGRFTKRTDKEERAKPQAALSADLLGFVLVPEVLDRTPPYVDEVRPGTPAAKAGLRSDDLVLFVNDHLVPSARAVRHELEFIDRGDTVRVTVMRQQELIEVTLSVEER